MRGSSPFRAGIVALSLCSLTAPALAGVVDNKGVKALASTAPQNIVIGFTGGFVRRDNAHHAPVQLAQRIRQSAPPGTYVQMFENRRRKRARKTILGLLDVNHDGVLSAQEKGAARIILYGHSWGAAAAVTLARELGRQGIPVLLTVQVDSIAKPGQNDSLIPDNVAEAVNFYQTHGMVHGRRKIAAADPAKTAILGNYLLDYRKDPIRCPQPALWDRVFTPDHMQSECDPQVWSQVERLVRQRLSPVTRSASAAQSSQPESSR